MFKNKSEAVVAMRASGMSPKEISSILNAHVAGHPEQRQDVMKIVNSAPFADMLKRRKAYLNSQLSKGFNRLQILAKLNRLYTSRKSKVTPWDFLKVEYTPVKKISGSKFDKMVTAQKEAKQNVEKLYGKVTKRPKATPRYSPKIRNVPNN